MDFSIDAVSIPLLLYGIVEIIKPFNIDKRLIPIITAIAGCISNMMLNGFTVETGILGVMLGFAASGIYEAVKGGKKINEDKLDSHYDNMDA